MYFLKDSVRLTDVNNRHYGKKKRHYKIKQHLFCRVRWCQYHIYPEFFGSSAIVCTNLFEVEGPCCFLPLSRVSNRCAARDIEVDFDPPFGTDRVFVAIPLPFNFNM